MTNRKLFQFWNRVFISCPVIYGHTIIRLQGNTKSWRHRNINIQIQCHPCQKTNPISFNEIIFHSKKKMPAIDFGLGVNFLSRCIQIFCIVKDIIFGLCYCYFNELFSNHKRAILLDMNICIWASQLFCYETLNIQ